MRYLSNFSLLLVLAFTLSACMATPSETKKDVIDDTVAKPEKETTTAKETAPEKIDFAKEIKPILESKCLICHHNKSNFTGLRFHTRKQILDASSDERPILIPGNPKKSTFYLVTTLPGYFVEAMPAGKHQLSEKEQDILFRWIEEGAEWPATTRLKPAPGADIVIDGVL